jgi:hypothetical protein
VADERMKAAPVLAVVARCSGDIGIPAGTGMKQSIEYALANFTHDHPSARRAGCQ